MNIDKFHKLIIKNNDVNTAIKFNKLLKRMSNKHKDFKKLMIGGGSALSKKNQKKINNLSDRVNKINNLSHRVMELESEVYNNQSYGNAESPPQLLSTRQNENAESPPQSQSTRQNVERNATSQSTRQNVERNATSLSTRQNVERNATSLSRDNEFTTTRRNVHLLNNLFIKFKGIFQFSSSLYTVTYNSEDNTFVAYNWLISLTIKNFKEWIRILIENKLYKIRHENINVTIITKDGSKDIGDYLNIVKKLKDNRDKKRDKKYDESWENNNVKKIYSLVFKIEFEDKDKERKKIKINNGRLVLEEIKN